MASDNGIFYACATVEIVGSSNINSVELRNENIYGIAHFYIEALDDLEAGSYINDMCNRNGLKFNQ